MSDASNLVVGDTNGTSDIFVKDLATGTVTRVSTDNVGGQGNNNSFAPVFSPDGTKIAFDSSASNLVAGDTNNTHDIFVKDLATGAVTRVSTDSVAVQGNGYSIEPVFSPDGTKIMFESSASNLVAGDTNNELDIFVKDLATGAVTRVSTDNAGGQGNSSSYVPVFSPDGTKIVFESNASNLVTGDTNGTGDIFVKDLATGTVTRVSTDTAGGQGNHSSYEPVFSPDGTKIMFQSDASNLVAGDTNNAPDIFVKDLTTGALTCISSDSSGVQGNGASWQPVFFPDGTKVAFLSDASNLVTGDVNGVGDIFLKDLVTGAVTRLGEDSASDQGIEYSFQPVFSADGTKVAFRSDDPENVGEDTNNADDIFVVTINETPTAKDDVFNGTQGVKVMGNVLSDNGHGADSDANGDTLTIVSGTYATANGSVTVAKFGTFTYTPNVGFHGVDTFEYTVQDGQGGTDVGLVSFNIAPINLAPVAKEDQFNAVEDTVLHGNVLADNGHGADSDANGDVLSVVPHDFITGHGGHVVLDSDGHFVYTPKADYAGYDSFKYTLSDGMGGHSIAKVSIQIADVADSFTGTDGNDIFIGGNLNDTIKGGLGNDKLYGGAGWDRLEGNEGNDVLYGGKGSDFLKGGAGADLFVVDGVTTRVDTIDDLRISKGDALQIKDILHFDPLHDLITDFVHIAQSGADSVLSVDADGLLNGVHFTDVVHITGVIGLDVAQLYADGDLIINNIIV